MATIKEKQRVYRLKEMKDNDRTEARIVLFILMCIALGFSAALISIVYFIYRLLI
jgi:hypothetical protein